MTREEQATHHAIRTLAHHAHRQAEAAEAANKIAIHTQRFNERVAYYGPDQVLNKPYRCDQEGCPVCPDDAA